MTGVTGFHYAHHDVFDDHLFCIHPMSKMIVCKPGIMADQIGLRETNLKTLKNSPHQDALKWRWDTTLHAVELAGPGLGTAA